MQCHLGWCVSFGCDFTLEPFARGLTSEDADNQAQRFVAVIMRRPVTSCVSRSSIAFLSRPDHNAVAPCRKVDLFALAAHIEVFSGGHHVIADRSGGPQARSSPSARQGRSEAEWLDQAEDGRTIALVMAAVTRGRSAAVTNETNETRCSEEGRKVTTRCRLRWGFGAGARSPI